MVKKKVKENKRKQKKNTTLSFNILLVVEKWVKENEKEQSKHNSISVLLMTKRTMEEDGEETIKIQLNFSIADFEENNGERWKG